VERDRVGADQLGSTSTSPKEFELATTPDWRQIRKSRLDLTDYVIHWTRANVVSSRVFSSFEVLWQIVQSGRLKPTFAPKERVTVGDIKKTIRGTYPAVCFTEQPLEAFVVSCDVLPNRYQPYGVAVRKDAVFRLGGRPVVYGDEAMLDALPEERKYLWVRFNPIPSTTLGGNPVDWTQEREWRVKPASYDYGKYGECPSEDVPLLLPPDYDAEPPLLFLPWILVKSAAEVNELRARIGQLPRYDGANGVLALYFEVLPNAPVVSVQEIKKRLAEGDTRWGRIDTLPYEELYPSSADALTQLGWRPL